MKNVEGEREGTVEHERTLGPHSHSLGVDMGTKVIPID